MYRRSISLLVLAAYAIAQWLAMPHAHEGESSGKHASTPHVHLASLAGESHHQHGLEHDHSQHGHEHDCEHGHNADQVAANSPEGQTLGLISFAASTAEHDDDAVYLPNLTTTTLRDDAGINWFALAAMLISLDQLQVPAQMAEEPCFADSGLPLQGGSCALYISLRTLRI